MCAMLARLTSRVNHRGSGDERLEAPTRIFQEPIEAPTACSSRREEALISQQLLQQRKLEPPHVGCYDGYEICRLNVKVNVNSKGNRRKARRGGKRPQQPPLLRRE